MKTIFFQSPEIFARMETVAKMLANSNLGVPEVYRGDVGSCFNAVDIAYRLGVSPLVVLQNSREIDGKPAFTYQFAKALIEESGLITGPLQYEIEGEIQSDGSTAGGLPYRVRAYGTTPTGENLCGPWINWRMAQVERWTDNPAYISMPEVMFRARATTFYFNQHCSSLLMGFQIEGDPAIGAAKAAPAAGGLMALPVYKMPDGAEPGQQLFADALNATEKANPTAIAAEAAKAVLTGTNADSSESGLAPAAGKEPAPNEPPKSRVRKTKTADSAKSQAQDNAADASGGEKAPPKLPHTENPSDPAPTGETSHHEQQESADGGGTREPDAQVEGSVDLLQLGQEAKPTSREDSIERFSLAFATVDDLAPTGESLKEAMELVQTFESQEAEDLYLVLMSNSERALTSFSCKGTGLSPQEAEFAALVRDLYGKTKQLATTNADLNDRRKALHTAYVGLLSRLQPVKQAAAA